MIEMQDKNVKGCSDCQHYMAQAPSTEAKSRGAWHHRPHEEKLLLQHCSSGKSGLSPCHQELEDEGSMAQGISVQKDSYYAHLQKKQLQAEMLWGCDVMSGQLDVSF